MSCFETCKNARHKGSVDRYIFYDCEAPTDVDCDKLERTGESAFLLLCFSLKSMKRLCGCDIIWGQAGINRRVCAFDNCRSLTRITIPLKEMAYDYSYDSIFHDCRSLASVNLPGRGGGGEEILLIYIRFVVVV
jgi:hypothetical protein